jgi:hypothetical protein
VRPTHHFTAAGTEALPTGLFLFSGVPMGHKLLLLENQKQDYSIYLSLFLSVDPNLKKMSLTTLPNNAIPKITAKITPITIAR